MADTRLLSTKIQSELAKTFLQKYQAESINQKTFLNMEFDLIAFSVGGGLHFTEITTSGFEGSKRGNFHIGGVRKVYESFSKFSIIRRYENENFFREQVRTDFKIPQDFKVECHFLIPEGSKFMEALGWRKKLFEMNVMDAIFIPLSSESLEILKNVLDKSRKENKKW